ncbi:hypothetical protein AVEN_261153-1 [Araneus ventricosus]|uniref:Uncharacterized protein n=1 Tax=Araneus ventricosus TaxID=182803 RepID=A0A4Y2J0U6_ARAVE|nr:hypothetical protein AVEN_261153-1 [Araneus ventricosus]
MESRKTSIRKLTLKVVNPDSFHEFKSLRSFVKYNIRKDYDTYLRLKENNLISDHKEFWFYFKNKSINSPKSLYYNTASYENDGDISNAFAAYFSSVFKPSIYFDRDDEYKATASVILLKSKA